jgi:hypothetical protein
LADQLTPAFAPFSSHSTIASGESAPVKPDCSSGTLYVRAEENFTNTLKVTIVTFKLARSACLGYLSCRRRLKELTPCDRPSSAFLKPHRKS